MLRASILVAVGFLGMFAPAKALAQITDPIPQPIAQGSIQIELEPIATGLVAPGLLSDAGDGTNRLFITDQAGTVRLVENGTLLGTPFLDVTSRLVALNPPYDERGLLGLAFHPEFGNPLSPHKGKLYTYTSEPTDVPADFTVPMPPNTPFDHQSVVAEWTVSAGDPNLVNLASRREIMRIDEPQFNHNGGMLAFGPDNNLYIALGDGGNFDDQGDGHNAAIGNGQDTSNVLGKILRIDVNGIGSSNGQYSVPNDNPFIGGGGVAEIFAYGFRNPYRFSFDTVSGDLLVGDVGQNSIEEIDRVINGGNYGWRVKEGTFLFDPNTGAVTADSPGAPSGMIDPLAQYDHDEGIAIVGGFIYHGALLPELTGKYVFGDFSRGFGGPEGRLFYADLDTGLIEEFIIGLDNRELELFVKGLGQDAAGELYLLASIELGPQGSTGVALAIVPVPEPSGLCLVALGGLLLLTIRCRRIQARS